MDAETIGKLIAMFASLGHDAKWAFIAYLGLHAFKIAAVAGTVLAIVVMVLRTVQRCQDDSAAFSAIRGLFEGVSWYERDRVVRKVTELVAKKPAP